MPTRLLRDWTDSEAICQLSAGAERFFTRLLMKMDDYGCYGGTPMFLRSTMFPIQLDSISEDDVSGWVNECEIAGVILLYSLNDRTFINVPKHGQRLRNSHHRYPEPTQEDINNCGKSRQLAADIGKVRPRKTKLAAHLNANVHPNANVHSDVEHTDFEKNNNGNGLPPDSIPLKDLIEDLNEWSLADGGKRIDEIHGVARPIQDLIVATSQQPHVIRNGKPIRPDLLIPVVVDFCKERRKEFKGLKYAITTVKTTLEEWAVKGMPGDRPATSSGYRPETAEEYGKRMSAKIGEKEKRESEQRRVANV